MSTLVQALWQQNHKQELQQELNTSCMFVSCIRPVPIVRGLSAPRPAPLVVAVRLLSFLGSIPHLNCTSSSIADRVLHDAQGNDLVCEEWTADGIGDDVEDILMPLLKILLILS